MSKRMENWEKAFKKPEPKKKKVKDAEPKQASRGDNEILDWTKGMKAQLVKYGERIPITKMQELYDFVFDNKEDLITVADHYLRTYTNRKRPAWKPGGITDRRNKRIAKILTFLKELKKNGNKATKGKDR